MDTFNVTVAVGDKKYETKGKTLLEAIQALKIPKESRIAILTIKKGSKQFKRPLYPLKLRQLLEKPIFQQVMCKTFEFLMK